MHLVLACCRWPRDDEGRALIAAIAGDGIDWDRLLAVARLHRVEPLVHHALRAAKIAVPGEAAQTLAKAAQAATMQSMALAAESLRLQRRFEAAGLPILFLKGAALAQMAYGTLAVKRSWDIDLLLQPGDVVRAGGILEADGYRCIAPRAEIREKHMAAFVEIEKESVWRRDADGCVVELHWRLHNNPWVLPEVQAGRAPSQRVALGGGALQHLADDETFAYLAVHGASHSWFRLKWLADLTAWLRRRPVADLERLHDRAVAMGAGRCPGQALLLANRLLGLPLPPSLERRLRKAPVVRIVTALAARCLTRGDGHELEERRVVARLALLSQLLLSNSPRYIRAAMRERWVLLDELAGKSPAARLRHHALRIPMAVRRMIGG
jgi:hypothetical protein